jgi:hypothetical protein
VTSGSCEVDRKRTSERASERATGRFHASVSAASPAASERVRTFCTTRIRRCADSRRSLASSLSLSLSLSLARVAQQGRRYQSISPTIFDRESAPPPPPRCVHSCRHSRDARNRGIPLAETNRGTRTAERVVSRSDGNQFFAQGHRAFKFSEAAGTLRPNGSSQTDPAILRFPPESCLNLPRQTREGSHSAIDATRVKGSRKTSSM